MPLRTRQLVIAAALAAAALACTKSGADGERPAALVGSWIGVDASTGDVVHPDPIVLTLAPDGSALFSRRKGGVTTPPMDSTVRFARWKVATDATTKAPMLCLQTTDASAASCDPIVAQGADSLVLGLRNLSSVLGGRISTVLHRSR